MSRKIFIISIMILVLLFIFIISTCSGIIIDYQWFKELGYTQVFFTRFIAEIKIGIPVFIVLFLLLSLYFNKIKIDYYKFKSEPSMPKESKWLNFTIWIGSFLIAFFSAISLANSVWSEALSYFNSVKFNLNDPIFNKDISLYMFKLPFIRSILNFLTTILIILFIITVLTYILMYLSDSTRFYKLSGDNLLKAFSNKDIIEILISRVGIFGLAFFILIGIGYYLKAFNLVYSPRGVAYGASYTDIHVTLLSFRILMVLSFLSGVLFFIGAIRKNLKFVFTGPVIMIAVIIISSIIAGLVHQLIVSPNELTKEMPYIKNNIKFTQKAFNLDKIKTVNYNYNENLTADNIKNNEATINNIRINDYRPINQVYNQLQGMRLYYKFNDVDIDRYNINGKYTQVFLSAREMSIPNLSQQAQTWINQHLKYTHGYGLVLSPVNTVNSQGQPVMYIKDIPPTSDNNIKITRPEVYFGELTNYYAVTNADLKEFNYPSGSNNVESVYNGTAGIKMNLFNKLLFAIGYGDWKLLLSSDINSNSKILINRNIMDRVYKIAPYLMYDKDPYIVINNDGRLYWIIDAYTVSDSFPYSQPYSMEGTNINYIRNSIKVVIDAYNGTTNYYVVDKSDPIAEVYKNIFPELYKDGDTMPEGLKTHLRYPQDLFDLQANVYKIYHMNNITVFYNREDAYDIAKDKYTGQVQTQESQYMITKLPGGTGEEYCLTIPFTPSQKDNMVAYMVARMDGDHYGEVINYVMSKDTTIYGPMQIEAKIDNSPDISKELSLWNQNGSEVLRGNTLVIPLDNSILYVEPLYIKSDAKESIPEVKRVIVAYDNKIVMDDSLQNALNKIFNINVQQPVQTAPNNNITSDKTLSDLIKDAEQTFNNANNAIKTGDWAKYGNYINRLGDIISKMKQNIK